MGNLERVESSSREKVQATGRVGGAGVSKVVLSGGTTPTLASLGVEGSGMCAGNDDSESLVSVVWSKKVPKTAEVIPFGEPDLVARSPAG